MEYMLAQFGHLVVQEITDMQDLEAAWQCKGQPVLLKMIIA